MRTRHPQTSAFLLLCAVTLIAAIFVGKQMGDRVIHQVTQTAVVVPMVATPTAGPTASDAGPIRNWKRRQVVTVATDPGFPDPRVTPPPPTPTPKPKPTRTPTPEPTPTPTPPPPPTETATSTPTPDTTPPRF
jgi:outer membrane biosynthesis protein TonB